MRLDSFMSHSALSTLNHATTTGATKITRNNGQPSQAETLIAENNKRIDGLLRHRNPTPEVRAQVEKLRTQFNQQLTKAAQDNPDPAKVTSSYRDARRSLSDSLTDLFGGPRAG